MENNILIKNFTSDVDTYVTYTKNDNKVHYVESDNNEEYSVEFYFSKDTIANAGAVEPSLDPTENTTAGKNSFSFFIVDYSDSSFSLRNFIDKVEVSDPNMVVKVGKDYISLGASSYNYIPSKDVVVKVYWNTRLSEYVLVGGDKIRFNGMAWWGLNNCTGIYFPVVIGLKELYKSALDMLHGELYCHLYGDVSDYNGNVIHPWCPYEIEDYYFDCAI